MTVYEIREFGRGLVWPAVGFEVIGAITLTAAVTLSFESPRLLELDATAGIFTVTLPAAPYEGLTFQLSERAGLTTAVTIDGNGKNINGASTLTLSAAYRQRTLRYNGAQWIVVAGIG